MASIIKVDQLSEKTQGSGITLSHSLKNSSGSEIISSSGLIESPTFVGMIASFAMSSAPTGWIVCNGAEYAIADYEDLHTAIGTTWGALTNGSGGAGSTHFRVPDLRGAFLRGTGTGTINTRNKAGGNVGDFNEDQYQGHIHQFTGYDKSGGGNNSTFAHSGSGNPRTGLAAGDYVGDAEINSQGTPRTGVETFPYNASIQYCIKY